VNDAPRTLSAETQKMTDHAAHEAAASPVRGRGFFIPQKGWCVSVRRALMIVAFPATHPPYEPQVTVERWQVSRGKSKRLLGRVQQPAPSRLVRALDFREKVSLRRA
jgi:hypothetical protein